MFEISFDMGAMIRVVGAGNGNFDRRADQRGAVVAEQTLGVAVDHDDVAVRADDDHRVGRRFEKTGERRVGHFIFRSRRMRW